MKCLKEKCIHQAVCALYTFSGYDSDECGFYETRPHGKWIPLKYNDDEKVTHTNFPNELDGSWVIVTDGKRISVERIKKDVPDDHFFPAGRWFELNEVVAWMPLPEPYKKEGGADNEVQI